jgi:hypothetical protein
MANSIWHPLDRIPRTSLTSQPELVSGQWNSVVPLFIEVTQDANLASQCLPLSPCNRNRSLSQFSLLLNPLVSQLTYNSKLTMQKMNGSSLKNSTTSTAVLSQLVSKTHHPLLAKHLMHLLREVISSSKTCVSRLPMTGV